MQVKGGPVPAVRKRTPGGAQAGASKHQGGVFPLRTQAGFRLPLSCCEAAGMLAANSVLIQGLDRELVKKEITFLLSVLTALLQTWRTFLKPAHFL